MHFRLPGPPHGWGVLSWDVAVVVIGVLIALGAQQFVDEINWSARVRDQRQSLDRDVAEGVGSAILRNRWQHCLDRRLADFELVFARRAAGEPIHVVGRVGLPYTVWSSIPTYESALDDGTLAHMPLAERQYYDNVVENIRNIFDLERQEYEVWLRLQRLEHPERMTENDWADLRGAFGEARALDQRVRANIPYSTGLLRAGAKPIDQSSQLQGEPWGDELCRPLLARRE